MVRAPRPSPSMGTLQLFPGRRPRCPVLRDDHDTNPVRGYRPVTGGEAVVSTPAGVQVLRIEGGDVHPGRMCRCQAEPVQPGQVGHERMSAVQPHRVQTLHRHLSGG